MNEIKSKIADLEAKIEASNTRIRLENLILENLRNELTNLKKTKTI